MPKRGMSPASQRHLKQYRDLSDEEFLAKIEDKSFDSLVKNKTELLMEGYDFSGFKQNDWDLFRRMASLMVRLESGEKALEVLIKDGSIDSTNALREEQRLATMRDGILKIQDILGLARIKREARAEEDPRKIFEEIRKRAQHFLRERLCQILCPNCGVLVCSVNFLFPERDNVLHIDCGKCGNSFDITSSEALQREQKNPYK